MDTVRLKHTETALDANNKPISSLRITVEVDAADATIEYIHSVEVYNEKARIYTDITAIMDDAFETALDAMVDKINWYEILCNELKNLTA